MRFFELLLVRSVLLVGLPLVLVLLAVGPQRFWKNVKRGWTWLWRRRLEPEEILTQVVAQYEKLVVSVRDVLAQSEIAEKVILKNIATSEKNVTALEAETKELAGTDDELGAARRFTSSTSSSRPWSASANSWTSSAAKSRSRAKGCSWWNCNCGSTKSGGASC